jgi:hypothetical protein
MNIMFLMLPTTLADQLAAIQADMDQPDLPLSGIVRQVTELGPAIRSPEFLDWATRELHGYGDADPPEYRRLAVQRYLIRSTGDGRGVPELLPVYDLPEETRRLLSPVRLVHHGLPEIETLIAAAQNGLVFLQSRTGDSELLAGAVNAWKGQTARSVHLSEAVGVSGMQHILGLVRDRIASDLESMVDTTYTEPVQASPAAEPAPLPDVPDLPPPYVAELPFDVITASAPPSPEPDVFYLPEPPPSPSPSDSPGLPDLPEPSHLPEVPDSPEVPDLPEFSSLPTVSDSPRVSDLPATYYQPEIPDSPEIPESHSEPSDLGRPEEPAPERGGWSWRKALGWGKSKRSSP